MGYAKGRKEGGVGEGGMVGKGRSEWNWGRLEN